MAKGMPCEEMPNFKRSKEPGHTVPVDCRKYPDEEDRVLATIRGMLAFPSSKRRANLIAPERQAAIAPLAHGDYPERKLAKRRWSDELLAASLLSGGVKLLVFHFAKKLLVRRLRDDAIKLRPVVIHQADIFDNDVIDLPVAA